MTARSQYALYGLLLVTSGILPVWAQAPASGDKSAEACPGTLSRVREGCGCDPREEAVYNALSHTKLNDDNLRSQLRHCFNLDGKADIKKFKLEADAGLQGCLEKVENQFPEYRATLAELVRTAREVLPGKVATWNCCYADKLGQNLQDCKSISKPAPSPGPPKAGSRSGSGSTTAAKPAPGIEQHVKATRGRVKAGSMNASDEGKLGPASIRQTVEASGDSTVEIGDMNAHVGSANH